MSAEYTAKYFYPTLKNAIVTVFCRGCKVPQKSEDVVEDGFFDKPCAKCGAAWMKEEINDNPFSLLGSLDLSPYISMQTHNTCSASYTVLGPKNDLLMSYRGPENYDINDHLADLFKGCQKSLTFRGKTT